MTDFQTGASTGPLASDEARARLADVRAEVAKAVVGQDAAVSGLLVALLCGGHVLMEGVPGVAKTLLVRSLAAALSVRTSRVQFTPDLMPGDITGSMVIDGARASCSFRQVPSSPTCSWPTRSTAPRPRRSRRCSRRWRRGRSSVDGVSHALPRPVPGRCHPEPGGVRGHLPSARGPARPLPAQGRAPGAGAGRGARDRAAPRDRVRPARRRRVGGDGGRRRRRHRRRATSRPRGAAVPRGRGLRRRRRAGPRVRHRPSGSAPAPEARCH